MQRQISMTIEPSGDTTIRVTGCPGPSCKDLTKALEKALGKTTQSVSTPDMHRPNVQQGVSTSAQMGQ